MTKSYGKSIDSRMRAREGRRCGIAGCVEKCNGLSNFCSRHKQNAVRYGTPTGRAIRRPEYRSDLAAARRYVRRHQADPALLATFGTLDQQLVQSLLWAERWPQGKAPKSTEDRLMAELARLATNQVHIGIHGARHVKKPITGKVIFTEVVAVWLFARRRPGALDPSGKALQFAAARAVLSLATRYRGSGKARSRRLSTRVLDHYGTHLVSLARPFFRHVVADIETEQQQRPLKRLPAQCGSLQPQQQREPSP